MQCERYMRVPPSHLLKDSPSSIRRAEIRSEKKFGIKEEQYILCRNCHYKITSPRYVITVNGRHRHTFINPAGITYQIGCFSEAEGCVVTGEPTYEYTWFQGFMWSYCLCARCYVHIGWFYQGDSEYFYGLILDMLKETGG